VESLRERLPRRDGGRRAESGYRNHARRDEDRRGRRDECDQATGGEGAEEFQTGISSTRQPERGLSARSAAGCGAGKVRNDCAMGKVGSPVAREALLAAAVGALVSAALVWLGPPGTDLAAHLYQRTLFIEHGFALWNNFWYAGRYSFITYSLLYYPLAAVLGIHALAVATVTVGATAFSILVAREWGVRAHWSSRTFALVWPGVVLTGEFPFALGIACALLALCALKGGGRLGFAALVLLTATASPVAFLLLCVILAAIALEHRRRDSRFRQRVLLVFTIGLAELVLWRAFPAGGHYSFSVAEAAAACAFCLLGAALTWRIDDARLLRCIFLIYLCACLAIFVFPSSIGENVARLRLVAIPMAVLALSLRAWRPRPVVILALVFAISWNVSPLAATVAQSANDPAATASYWQPAIGFLKAHLSPSYRVEAVDTAGHWPAVYFPRAGIPLARGWFRQNDFPQNSVLYGPLGRGVYLRWLRGLGVRYVVLSTAAPDYSARRERRLIDSGRSGLRPVFRSRDLAVFEVPSPRAIVVGAGHPRVLVLQTTKLLLDLDRAGEYRIAVRYSPYWDPSRGCVSALSDGMTLLHVPRPGVVSLRVVVDAEAALKAVAGMQTRECSR
jgi:hypothetical protein